MDWNKLKDKFFRECTDDSTNSGINAGIRPVNKTSLELFNWFKNNIKESDGNK